MYRINDCLKTYAVCCVVAVMGLLLLVSCSGSKNLSKTNYRELARAGLKLGVDIAKDDNHVLFVETSKWVGVPYRSGGKSRRGVDCSGLTLCIYQNTYGVKLSPNSQMQLDRDVKHAVRKSKLRAGDLVFFSERRSRRRISHVGIYLKEGKFIHASTSRGVRVDLLDDAYWKRRWITGGRVVNR